MKLHLREGTLQLGDSECGQMKLAVEYNMGEVMEAV
jgi:hypothetical protein